MSLFAFPASPDAPFVADASVVIGLNASGHARKIIQLTKSRIIVPENAANELAIGARFGHDDGYQLNSLIADGIVDVEALKGAALAIYETLIDGTLGETLDDGEAATIALAVSQGGVALIDERKARRICEKHFNGITIGSTAQLILAASCLGESVQIEAMLHALRRGRLRVPPEFVESVVSLIGAQEAATCQSLPRVARLLGSNSKP
ncbi:hypothetical protein GCM10007908_04110 [Rhizobium albus]|nr:hypothetical protein GCM10007908_04110 [Rhizobium albus]